MNTPPRSPYDTDTDAVPPEPRDPAHANPYLDRRADTPGPDLDAAAPTLRTEEQQRLNRKALLFLGGIVLLLMLLAVLVLRGNKDDAPAPQQTASIDVPTLTDAEQLPSPASPMASMPADPIALEPMEEVSLSPPLPPPPPPDYGPSYDAGPTVPSEPRALTLMERRMGAVGGESSPESAVLGGAANSEEYANTMLAQAQAQQAAPAQTPVQAQATRPTSARVLGNRDALLVRGTYLRCVLETRIVTDYEGFTSCILNEPVYSINGRRLLLPKGSKILGSYRGEANGPRIAVVWDRITTPTGLDVNMSSPGIDNLGGAGHPGHYTNHWPSKIASALLVSLISDAFKYGAAENGPRTTRITDGGTIVDAPFESNTARTMDRMANEIISRNLRRPATVTINQGSVVAVYVARDVDFASVLSRR